jgi:hypothetical protein
MSVCKFILKKSSLLNITIRYGQNITIRYGQIIEFN